MKAKFRGRCRVCDGVINVGDEIRWSKAEGARHADAEVCEFNEADYEMRAEQRAEMRAEAWAEARMMGTTEAFWQDGW